MTQRLTGRMEPFQTFTPTPDMPASIDADLIDQEPLENPQIPEFSLQLTSLVETRNGFT